MRKLLYIILLVVCVVQAGAFAPAPKRAYVHDQDFILEHPYTIVDKALPLEITQRFREVLPKNGAQEADFFKKIFARKIRFQHVKTIAGTSGLDALIIEVTDKSVRVRYTSLEAAERAVELLSKAVVRKRGVAVLQGTDILDWGEGAGVVRHKAGDIDLSKMALQTRAQLEAIVAKNPAGSELEMTLVGAGGWLMESRTLDELNPHEKIANANNYYSPATVRHVIDYAATRNVVVIPRFDLYAQREAFRRVTGHEVGSVEGMRIVRALIGEWSQAMGVTEICVTQIPGDQRFNEFLEQLPKIISVNIVTK